MLVSWAVPKGPTLDADVRRMAVHVEDHPLDYFDFEGVIPAGEYGGGDVVVWDWGTWALAEADDPLAAIAAGDLHVDLAGEKLRGRFVLVRTGAERDWLLLKKHDDAAVTGWDPEDHPRSVKSGRTNDEVAAAPAASWTGTANWAPAAPDELAALDSLGRSGSWTIGDHQLALTDLDRVVVKANRAAPAVTKRDLVRYVVTATPVLLAYLGDRAVDLCRAGRGAGASWSWRRTVPARAPSWLRRWDDDVTAARTSTRLVLDSVAALAWAANDGAVELHPWRAALDHPRQPTWAVIELDGERGVRPAVELARLFHTAFDHLGVRAGPLLTGGGIDLLVPVASGTAADHVRRWTEQIVEAVAGTVPDRAGSMRGAGASTFLAPFSPRAAPGAPVAVPLTWDELDDADVVATGWRVGDVGARIERAGDPLAPLVGLNQRLAALS